MKSHRILIAVAASFLATTASWAQPKPAPECHGQKIENALVEMCLLRGGAFRHDTYMLRADGVVIFALADDYVEQVELQHTVPEGPAIEFPLSKQGEKVVKITGGCLPEIKDGAETARICNFRWGKLQVVKDQRFAFE